MPALLQPGGPYRRGQGKVPRQVTFSILVAAVAFGAFRLFYDKLKPRLADPEICSLIIGVVLALGLGLWLAYRIVNYPPFADYLIEVEAEINAVSWPTRRMLVRGFKLVVFVTLALAAILFCYDLLWQWLFDLFGIVKTANPGQEHASWSELT